MTELETREMGPGEETRVIDYFLNSDTAFLKGMGVDPARLPDRDRWTGLIREDMERTLEARQFYYLLWVADGEPVGHSNINKIEFGHRAFMHLHLWRPDLRRSGLGQHFIRACISRYFTVFKLERLICEPYVRNPGPNKTLEKAGFTLVKTHDTVPGWINFHQTVNRWILTRNRWKKES